MIRSMTGYGDAQRETAAGVLRVEVKTVNHRYLRVNVRTPGGLDHLELPAQEWLGRYLERGQVNCSVRLERPDVDDDGKAPLTLNEERAGQYVKVLRAMKERFDLPGPVDVALVSRFGDVIEPETTDPAAVDPDDVRAVVEDAARAAVTMREEEGRRLHDDLEERLRAMEDALDVIDERAPARLTSERDRLREAIAELADDVSVDEDRLAQEIAYLAERWDISEEQVRLRAHIDAFRELLEDRSEEPVGKRLGFLVQEMHRETNTIGSKANDAVIEHRVVAVKNEIERLREQINNVE